jgi:uncharacterized glyoxalase superfamily protein PhnB
MPEGTEKEDHVEYHSPNGYRLAWDAESVIKSFDPSFTMPDKETRGRITLAFKCKDSAEVDTLHKKLVGMGYFAHKDPWDAFWGQRYSQMLDPDGNVVDLFAPL